MPGLIDSPLFSMKQGQKPSRWQVLARLALITLFFLIVIIVLLNWDLAIFKEIVAQHQNLTFLIGLLAISLTSFSLIPTIPFTMVLAVLSGPLPATLMTAFGTTLTALIHYQIGKQIGDVVNFEEKKARLPLKLGNLPVNSLLFLLVGRAIPGGPTGLSFVFGAYGVPHFLYVWTTFLTNLLGAAIVAFGFDRLISL